MTNLIECSIDELLTERQNAIEVGNIERYRECNELISTWSAKIAKKLQLVEMLEDLKTEIVNYCIVFDNQKIGIEIPVSSDSHTSKAKRYICENFLQLSVVDPDHGLRVLKEGVDYTSMASAKNWGYTILPL